MQTKGGRNEEYVLFLSNLKEGRDEIEKGQGKMTEIVCRAQKKD